MTIIFVLGQRVNSVTVREDKMFLNKWNMLLTRFSAECRAFANAAGDEAMGDLTLDQACSHLKEVSFKSSALDSCTMNEYDAAVALVCVSGSSGESGNQGSSTTLNQDKTFLKNWIALLKTFSVKCRRFVVGSSTEPIGDLTHYQACKYVKLDSFKRSTLEACSQHEYSASVELVCKSGSTHLYLACSVMLLCLFLHLLRKM